MITRLNSTFLAALLVLAATGAMPVRASAETILRVGPTQSPPVVDGNLGDSCWQAATMASGFVTNHREWPRAQTTGYLTYDDIAIYIAWRCNKAANGEITAKTTANDDESIFGDSSVEIFLDTDHDRTTYYQFVVSPTGVRYEGYIKPDDGIRAADWNPEWEVKTSIHAVDWTAEMRIPYASLAASRPRPGDVWGLNLNRNYYEADVSEHSSWAMIQGGFNRPRHFGQLRFGSGPGLSYSIVGMTGRGLRIKLRNGKASPLAVQTEWGSSDLLAAPMTQVAATHLEPEAEQEIFIPCDIDKRQLKDVPLTHKGPRMALRIRDPASGEVYDSRAAWIDWGAFRFPALPAVTLDRYYYTQADSEARVRLTPEIEGADRFEVEIRQQTDGRILAARQIAIRDNQETSTAAFDLAALDAGRYLMISRLLGKDDERLYSVRRVFFKTTIAPAKIPSPTPEIGIRADGIILVDQKPFCPFFAGNPTSPLCNDTFNVRFGPSGVVSRPLERLAIGLPGLTRPDGPWVMVLPEEAAFYEHLREVVTPQIANPLLLSWLLSYEAEFPMYRAGTPKTRLLNADELGRISAFIKRIDPNHLTALQIDQGHWARYKDSADIIEVGCPGSAYMEELIPPIIDDVKEVRNDLGPGKPFIVWLGAALPYPRTAEEIRGASYLALMHGAAGIVFHMGHGGIPAELTRHWSVYAGLSREIETLFPILTARKLTGSPKISVQPTGAIDFCLREHEGRMYLVAVNTSDSYVDARISIGADSAVLKELAVLFENRRVTPERNSFTDGFTSYEPHVYELVFGNQPPP